MIDNAFVILQALTNHPKPMISNEQMEKLWWQYKNEGVAKNISMQAFCSMHNVPYNAFEKYLKLRRHFSDVHHISVTDLPLNGTHPIRKEILCSPKGVVAPSFRG